MPSELDSPCIGNPYGIFTNGQFIRTGSDYQFYYADKTAKLILNSVAENNKVVLELGGGYGGYAFFLKKKIGSNLTYVDIDLPETLALATFHLMAAFPKAKFALYGETIEWSNLSEFDFVMMPSFQIENIKESSVNLIFNSFSLAEMDPSAIRNYVSQFGRIAPEYLFHVNHTTNSKLGADGFGLENAGFYLMEKIPALWNLGRSTTMDEFEYVYTFRQ